MHVVQISQNIHVCSKQACKQLQRYKAKLFEPASVKSYPIMCMHWWTSGWIYLHC